MHVKLFYDICMIRKDIYANEVSLYLIERLREREYGIKKNTVFKVFPFFSFFFGLHRNFEKKKIIDQNSERWLSFAVSKLRTLQFLRN